MNYLALDWGKKRIGLAVASSLARIAREYGSLRNDKKLFKELEQIIKSEQVNKVIVGLPRNLEGEETKQSAEIRNFAKELKARLNLPIEFQDESLTSIQALDESKRSKKITDKDSRAAAIILQDYLDERNRH